MNLFKSKPAEAPAITPLEHLPHTFDGVLSRSDRRLWKRVQYLINRVAEARAEAEARFRGKEITAADATAATQHRQGIEEQARENPGHDFSAELKAAIEKEKHAHAIDAKEGAKLTAANIQLHDDTEHLANVKKLVGGLKTAAEIPFAPSEVYSAGEIEDVRGAFADRTAMLHERQGRRVEVANGYQSPEVVERALLRQLDTKAAAGEIVLSGLHGERRTPTFSLPTRSLNAEPNRYGGNGYQPRVVDVEALACRYWRDEIAADIKEAVAREYETVPPEQILDAHERHRLLRSLDAEIDKLQREIADLVWLAIDEGHDLSFPADLPARAILGVA